MVELAREAVSALRQIACFLEDIRDFMATLDEIAQAESPAWQEHLKLVMEEEEANAS